MTGATFMRLLAALVLVAMGAALMRTWMSADRDRVMLRRRVLVNLDTGRAFSGVLWSKTGDWLVLRNAEMLERGSPATPVDGELILDRRRVEFLQAL
jgi:hypothetical protein